MNKKIALTIVALGLALPAISLNAQDGPRPPRGPRGDGPRPPGPPLIAKLDLNHDGTIDASELNAAPESLRALDKNGDGKLTPDELGGGRGPGPRNEAVKPDETGNAPARRPGPPLVAALDANHDGVIDATEISNATTALKALDKNGDGQITRDEVGGRGPGGPRGGGPEGARKRRPQPEPEQ